MSITIRTGSRRSSNAAPGCLIVFALPFVAAGLVLGFLAARTVYRHHQMQTWEEVAAQIRDAQLKVDRSSDSTTYRATARYTYTYGGQTHTGTSVSLSGGSDNLGSFHQRTHERLDAHKRSGEPCPCFVNPSDPSESILVRELRWGLLAMMSSLALIFGGAGVGIIIAGAHQSRREKVKQARKAEHPDEPWLWDPKHADGVIVSSNKVGMVVAIVMATVWNAISFPVAILAVREAFFGNGNSAALIALIFPICGLGLAAWAIVSALRWKKFGQSRFMMASVPGVVGGKLAGAVVVPVQVTPEGGFRVQVSCINRVTTGTGKHRSTREHIRWQDERTIAHEVLDHDRSQSAVPVLFHIPYDAQPTDDRVPENTILWRLEVSAKVPGVDYNGRFEVPVYRTPESSPDFVLDESAIAAYEAPRDERAILAAAGVHELPISGGGLHLRFPPARHKGTAAVFTGFLLIWTGVVVTLVRVNAPLLFPIVFGALNVLILLGALDMWLQCSTLEVRKRGITYRSGWLGFGATRTLAHEDINELGLRGGEQVGSRLYFRIVARTRDGKRHVLAKRLAGRPTAESLVERIKRAMAGES